MAQKKNLGNRESVLHTFSTKQVMDNNNSEYKYLESSFTTTFHQSCSSCPVEQDFSNTKELSRAAKKSLGRIDQLVSGLV